MDRFLARTLASAGALAVFCASATPSSADMFSKFAPPPKPAPHAPQAAARGGDDAPVAPKRRSKLAPADEYFGRQKMSILGIRNTVRDLGLKADADPEHSAAVLGPAFWAEESMRDWARKYPQDTWLPRTAFSLERLYEKVPNQDGRALAMRELNFIVAYFPASDYARLSRAEIAMGIPTPVPPPEPVETAAAEPTGQLPTPKLTLAPSRRGAPTASPAPTTTPSASPVL